MKLLHDEGAAPMRREKSAAIRKLAKFIIPGMLAFAPMLEGTARAEVPLTQPAAPQPGTGSMAGQRAILQEGGAERNGCMVVRGRSAPIVTVEGPARFTVRIYPIMLGSLFPTGSEQQSRSVEYTFGQAGSAQASRVQVQAGLSGRSALRAECVDDSSARYQCVDPATSVIGTPIEVALTAPQGTSQLSVLGPNGIAELVRVERIVTPPQEVVPPAPVPRPQPAPRPAPAVEAPQEEPARRPIVTFDGDRTWLHSLGSARNSGDINRIQPVVYAWLGDNFGIVATAMFSSYGLSLDTPESQTSFRNYSGDLGAGLAYRNGRHVVYALGFAGYRAMATDTLSLIDGRSLDNRGDFFEYGGQAAYSYGEYAGIRVTGSSNPFNPISARLWGVVPYTWAGHSYPFAEADLMWLNAMTPVESADVVGAARLDESTFHMRAMAGIPIYPIGPVTPFALLGGEMTASGDGFHGSAIFGGLLRLSLIDRLDVEAGAASNLSGAPLMLLRMNYSR